MWLIHKLSWNGCSDVTKCLLRPHFYCSDNLFDACTRLCTGVVFFQFGFTWLCEVSGAVSSMETLKLRFSVTVRWSWCAILGRFLLNPSELCITPSSCCRDTASVFKAPLEIVCKGDWHLWVKINYDRSLPNFQDIFVCVTKKHLVTLEIYIFFLAVVGRLFFYLWN